MHRALDRVTLEVTVHLLVAGFALIGASLAGVGATLPLVGVLLLVSVALFAAKGRVPSPGPYLRADLRRTLGDVWIAGVLAATTSALALGATAGELQALGGILGLVAMANYFLRPLYHVAYSLVASVLERTRPENG